MKQISNNLVQSAYNKEVRKQYYKLLKHTLQLIGTIERHELRCTLQRINNGKIAPFQVAHELISPIIYLSLKAEDGEFYRIYWGFEQFDDESDYSHITARFVRSLYKLTATENTTVDIEDCINTDSIITNCSDLYECVEDNNHHHQFVLVEHKPTVTKRKQMRAVA